MAGPGRTEFQLRSGRGGARSRPWAKNPINDHTGSLMSKLSRRRTAAPASRFSPCPRVVRCGAGRSSSSTSTRTALCTPRWYSHCACGCRTARNHRRTVDSGRPNRAAMLRNPAPPALATRALPIASVRSAPPHQQFGRQQDLGDLAVSAAGPPRGHGHRVGSDAADGAGATGPERAQHTPTPRAGHVPRQQDLLGPLGARHDHHGARLHSCQPALPITPRRREGPVGVARGQLSPRAVTKLPTRPAVGERPTIPGPTDRPTWASRFVGAVVTPTNHHRAHPVSASPVTTAPAVIGTHDGVQQSSAEKKHTFGFHPLLAFLDRPDIAAGEALAGLLRPGNAGSNTAADHVTVLGMALAQLPPAYRPRPADPDSPKILIRTDSAGGTHVFAKACRAAGVGYSFGVPVIAPVKHAVELLEDSNGWYPAINTDGTIRDGAWVAEATGLVDLSAWPQGTRLILRKERPHPGAQLTFTDHDGHRVTAFITDTGHRVIPGHFFWRYREHRQHARVEDRIRQAKAMGLRNFPCHDFQANTAWLEIVMTATDLVAWTKLIGWVRLVWSEAP